MSYLEYKDMVQTDQVVDGVRVQELMYTVKNNIKLEEIGGLNAIFKQVWKMKNEEKNIVDFEVTRSSLEQVFTSFAKHQIQ